MAEPARRTPVLSDDDLPSLDPLAIDRAYRMERARRRARIERRSRAQQSHVRFYFVLMLLCFATAFIVLASWRLVQSMFGV